MPSSGPDPDQEPTPRGAGTSWRPGRKLRASIAAWLALVGAVLVWVAVDRPLTPGSAEVIFPQEHHVVVTPSATPTATPTPTPTAATARTRRTGVRDRVTGPVLPESDPVAVSLPRIRVRSNLVDLGLDREGALEVPRDPAVAGWFDRGAAPGALGPAVIAGHVTWNGAPGVFYRLGSLRAGDRVSVRREDGKTAVFTVTRVAQYAKSEFPSRAVYGPIDYAGLRLITCGGTYDAARHRYLDNVVVFARLTSVR